MAARQVVHLRIEVPDDVDIVPLIVRKASPATATPLRAGPATATPLRVGKNIKFDLTTAKAADWLNAPGLRADNCCCVRGFIG
jgi:hypothetical protein